MTTKDFVGTELRRAREARGLSRAAIGKELYVSESLVTKWENGLLIPTPDNLGRLMEMLDIPDMLDRVIENLVGNEISPEWFKWPQIEAKTGSLWSFQTTVVPGLLQTEPYARAVLQAGRYHLTDVEDMVRSRLERQQVLTREDSPPILVAVMSETVLRQQVATAAVMHDQLSHLAEMAERQNVIVYIVPFTAGAGAGFASPFVIASIDGGKQIAYVDNQLNGEVIDDTDEVAALRRIFEIFRGAALSADESLELIRKAAAEWAS